MTITELQQLAAALALVSLVWLVIGAGLYIWYAVMLARVFTEFGRPAWSAWVPVYNDIQLFAIGRQPRYLALLLYLPFVQVVGLWFKVLALHRIGRQCWRGAGTTVVGVLLPPVWATIIATGPSPDLELGRFDAQGARRGIPIVPPRASGPLGVAPVIPAPAPVPAPVPAPMVVPAPAPAPAPDTTGWAAFAGPDAAPRVIPSPIAPPPAAAAWVDPVIPAAATPAAATPVAAADSSFFARPPAWAPASSDPSSEHVPGRIDPLPPLPPSMPPTPIDLSDAETIVSSRDDVDLADALDHTVVVERRPVVRWSIVTDDGARLALEAATVVLGRNPRPAAAGEQRLVVPDPSRTLSKTHAVMRLDGEQWTVTDLGSTNGVVVIDAAGDELLLDSGVPTPVAERLVLGTLGVRVEREQTGVLRR